MAKSKEEQIFVGIDDQVVELTGDWNNILLWTQQIMRVYKTKRRYN